MRTAARSLYRVVLRDALKITWRNKYLWPFGLFAGMLLSGSALDMLIRNWNWIISLRISADYGLFGGSVYAQAVTKILAGTANFAALPWWWYLTLLVLIVLTAFLIWLSIVSQATLLSGLAAVEEHKRPRLQKFFNQAKKVFWPVLGLNVFIRVAVALLVLVVSLLLIPAARTGDQALTIGAVVSFVILIPLAFAAVIVTIFSALGVVRFKESFAESIAHAWHLVAGHWLVVLETAAVLLLVDLLVAVAVTVGVMLITVPFIALFMLARLAGTTFGFWAVLALYLLIVGAEVLLAASILITYHYSVWTLLLERLRSKDKRPVAKLIRLSHKISNLISG